MNLRLTGKPRNCSLGIAGVLAQLTASAELSGQPLPVMDGLRMATVRCHGLTVAWSRLFERSGLVLEERVRLRSFAAMLVLRSGG